MWEMNQNWDEIREDILLGTCPKTADDIDRIVAETQATAILSLQSDVCRAHFGIDYEELRAQAKTHRLTMVNAPMLEFDPPDQRRNLSEAVRSLHELLAAGHRVYVHCTTGLSRSPLVVLGYLTFVEMQSPDLALAALKEARPGADPSLEAYYGCREDLVDILHDHILVRAYYLAEENPLADSAANWFQAERDVLRGTFVNARLFPRRRLDPNRETWVAKAEPQPI
jgi:Predicted protein-tyrosine phosphatase